MMINESSIRDFALKKNDEALTKDGLRKIAYDYLNKVIRDKGNFPRWPVDIKEAMNSYGVMQCPETGRPTFDSSLEDSWASRARRAEELQKNQADYIVELERQIDLLSGVKVGMCDEN